MDSTRHIALLTTYFLIVCSPLTNFSQHFWQKPPHCAAHRCIFGKPPTIEELLDPVEEKEVGDDEFLGGDKEIADAVQRQIAIENGDIIEVDSDDEDGKEDENTTLDYTFAQVFMLGQQLKDACLQFGELGQSFDLSKWLQAFRASKSHTDIHRISYQVHSVTTAQKETDIERRQDDEETSCGRVKRRLGWKPRVQKSGNIYRRLGCELALAYDTKWRA
ncbi:uncharacterized protein EDB91DRAFT_1083513 [Suillus paluster]|uniref:uncharacterized protein n=1 Tax=Suillus paluster TaxID=48578 RepID=UPI001B881A52|nr:uncharacterized protein EDB91DRAFT_1083513 [Suillus paluster]KAG1735880.1 hypothetical protein EDB91DRAFT_1083513 [Suillus paluster]